MQSGESADPFIQAMSVLSRAAGDELQAFMGVAVRVPVSLEGQESAGRVLLQMAQKAGAPASDMSEGEKLQWAIHEVKAQAFEAWWAEIGDRAVTRPAKRSEIVQFIESRTGRPLPQGGNR
jgi:hypothetical protein